MNYQKGFFGSLFDLTFTNFVFPKLIKLLFVLSIFLAGIVSIAFAAAGIREGGPGLAKALFSPVMFIILVIYFRTVMELMVVLFRIADDIRTLAQRPPQMPVILQQPPQAPVWTPPPPPDPPAPPAAG